MSVFASVLRGAYRLSGAKKSFALPEEEIRRVIAKQNRHRGVFTPTDRKAYYETVTVNGFPCLIVRENPKPSRRAILYFFGGGMVIGPDYMISGSRGDFSGVGDIHFFYSSDEVLYGALPDFEEACRRADVPYTAFARPGMVHCYCMLPCFREAKEDFAKIADILKK